MPTRITLRLNALLRTVLASVTGTLLLASAHAVHVADNGLGQALIFPYYSVRGGNISVISLVNHTAVAKALKVRFIEGRASKEVLDFNLYLSPNDQWGAALYASPAGGTILYATDRSCTTPAIPSTGVNFRNFAFAQDPLGSDISRTQEGYAEIIEMADILPGSATERMVTHMYGIPSNCGALNSVDIIPHVIVGSGGLSGQGLIINPNSGSSYGYTATALENFAKNSPVWFEPGSIDPNLSHVNPKISTVFDKRLGMVVTDWSTGRSSVPVDAVSAVLTRSALLNTYSINPGIGAISAWAVTLPTKSYYYRGNAPVRLFSKPLTASGACVPVTLTVWDAEERPQAAGISDAIGRNQTCWESAVINFGNSDPLLSRSAYATDKAIAIDGNARLSFDDSALDSNGATTMFVSPNGVISTRTNVVYVGLPAIGFQVNRMAFGVRPYPTLYDHRGETDIR